MTDPAQLKPRQGPAESSPLEADAAQAFPLHPVVVALGSIQEVGACVRDTAVVEGPLREGLGRKVGRHADEEGGVHEVQMGPKGVLVPVVGRQQTCHRTNSDLKHRERGPNAWQATLC